MVYIRQIRMLYLRDKLRFQPATFRHLVGRETARPPLLIPSARYPSNFISYSQFGLSGSSAAARHCMGSTKHAGCPARCFGILVTTAITIATPRSRRAAPSVRDCIAPSKARKILVGHFTGPSARGLSMLPSATQE